MLCKASKIDFSRYVAKGLDWVVAHLDQFNPCGDDGVIDTFANKTLCELLLMCEIHCRLFGRKDPQVEVILRFCETIWRYPHYRENLVRNPHLFRLYGGVYLQLRRCAMADDGSDELVRRMIDTGYIHKCDDVPFRRLDLRCMLDGAGYQHPIAPLHDIYRQTLLARNPPLAYLCNEDVYNITHTVFYISDWTFGNVTAIPEEEISHIRWTLGVLLGVYLRKKNWDLVGELLIACLGMRWLPEGLWDTAVAQLCAAQRDDGSFVGPRFDPKEYAELCEDERPAYDFDKNYHTTLVGIICMMVQEHAGASSGRRPLVHGPLHKEARSEACYPPLGDRIEQCGARAEDWISATYRKAADDEGRGTLEIIMNLLICSWLLDGIRNNLGVNRGGGSLGALLRAPGRFSKRTLGFAEAVIKRLKSPDCSTDGGDGAWVRERLTGIDAALVFWTTGILRQLKVPVPPLEDFAMAMADVLKRCHGSAGVDDFATARLFLSFLDMCAPAKPFEASLGLGQRLPGLKATQEELDVFMQSINIALQGGVFDNGPDDPARLVVRQYASIWMFSAIENYDLDRVAIWLRILSGLEIMDEPALGQGVSFLLDQQAPDGSMGFFAPNIARHGEGSMQDRQGMGQGMGMALTLMRSSLWAFLSYTVNMSSRARASGSSQP